MSLQWKSAGDRVVIKPDEVKKETETGIYLPKADQSSIKRGVVLAAGPDAHGVLPGDRVSYQSKYAISLEEGVVSADLPAILTVKREVADEGTPSEEVGA